MHSFIRVLLCTLVVMVSLVSGADPVGRVVRRGQDLLLDGKPFRFASYNLPSLLLSGDKTNNDGRFVWPDRFDIEDTIRTMAAQVNPVGRTQAFGIKSTLAPGPDYHVRGCRDYNEQGFLIMDFVLDYAAKHNVKLIIPLVNNDWHDATTGESRNDFYGNWGDFAYLCAGDRAFSAFFENVSVRSAFKDFLTFLLNRVNSVNGKRYGDDPTILALETGNELGSWEETPPPGEWTADIARHVKALAPYLLVADGTLIGGDTARMKIDSLQSPEVDLFSNHAYFGAATDIPRMEADMKVTAKYDKAFWCGEFGLYEERTNYRTVLDYAVKSKMVGIQIWSLRSHSILGGFYTHTENEGAFFSYHAPGFPERLPGFGPEEEWLVPLMFRYAAKIAHMRTPPYPPLVGIPFLLPARSGADLRWQGVAWAEGYDVQRAVATILAIHGEVDASTASTPGLWMTIGHNIPDNVPSNTTIFSDPLVTNGGLVFYRVRAVGHGGRFTPFSSPLGPISPPLRIVGDLPRQFTTAIRSALSSDLYLFHDRTEYKSVISTTPDDYVFTSDGLTSDGFSIRNVWSRQCLYVTAGVDWIQNSGVGADCSDYPSWTLAGISGRSTIVILESTHRPGVCLQWDGNRLSLATCSAEAQDGGFQRWDLVSARK